MNICKAPNCNEQRYQSPKGKKYSYCGKHKGRMSRLGSCELPVKKPRKTPSEYWVKHKEKADYIKKGEGFLIYCASCSKSFISSISINEWEKAPLCYLCIEAT